MARRHRVDLTDRAKQDIAHYHSRIALDKPQAAERWAKKVVQLAKSLRRNPERYEEIPEADQVAALYRHALHGAYRIIYRIDEDVVTVIRVLHGARMLRPRDLE